MAAILFGSGFLRLLFVSLVSLVSLVADVILYQNQFTTERIWPILLLVSRSMLLPVEEKNDCKRGAPCVNLNMKELWQPNLRSWTLIHNRRAAEP